MDTYQLMSSWSGSAENKYFKLNATVSECNATVSESGNHETEINTTATCYFVSYQSVLTTNRNGKDMTIQL